MDLEFIFFMYRQFSRLNYIDFLINPNFSEAKEEVEGVRETLFRSIKVFTYNLIKYCEFGQEKSKKKRK